MAEAQPPSTAPLAAAAPPVKPINHAIAVGLSEASLDSPTFRATATHFADQTDAVEKWLTNYVSSTAKLTHDILALEETINSFLSKTIPSATDGVIDNDYTFLALKRVGDGSRECWMQTLGTMKRMDSIAAEPIRAFLSNDMRNFKEIRRNLEHTQRTYDSTLSRYASQSKTKEPSSLREDAFSVFESRKAYIQASMDYCQLAPQLRFTMDKLLVRVCSDIWKELKRWRDAATNATRFAQEMDRVRGWAKEMELSEGVFRRELQIARRDLSEVTIEQSKPSRELEDYSTSTVPFLGTRGPLNMQPKDETAVVSEKQGWLFIRTWSGKPVRHTWVRRWFYCRGGVFGWLVQAPQGVLQGDEIGVLLCSVRPAVSEDRRFCFEVKTKSQTMILQTEDQKDLTEWLEVFEITKKKAFEATMDRDSNSLPGAPDPAFSISPPSIPEFSAKTLEAQIPGTTDDSLLAVEKTSTLQVAPSDTNLAVRQSFDPGSVGRRSISALGRDLQREEGESGREHASRIIQKLDLHRRATFGSGPESNNGGSGVQPGGVASLISSSHSMLPGYPNPSVSSVPWKQSANLLPSVDSHPGTLAPLTLAKPPATTALSRNAVAAAGDRDRASDSKKLPASVVANYWGSNVWASINVPERPVLPRFADDDPVGVVVQGHDRTPVGQAARDKQTREALPSNYPPELRAQNAQFRLLFPNVPLEEKLVLVFRASWSSSSGRDSSIQPLQGDGRIYLTPDNMYFYGQQMGLVTAYTISLDIISEVSAASGRDCDFIFLNFAENMNDTGYTKIILKVFLDNLRLLHTRLNLLVDNLQAEEPLDTRALISAMGNVESEEYDKNSPGADSWEEVSANTPVDDGTAGGRPVRHSSIGHREYLQPRRLRPTQQPKVHLPTHPVIYEPEGMKELAAERHFEISAKACFHVLFGDKSFVFPKLYFERRAQQIAQGPWVLVDQGRMRRDFQFKVDEVNMLGRSSTLDVNDYQTIDVLNDHVTYVVTHTKTAWHLPHSQYFKIIAKIVITHVAKSRCKLAIFLDIDWSKPPAFSKNLVERQALRDAASDADDLAELATDQVRKLGPRSRTNRAIQVYGHVGEQTQVVVFSPASTDSAKKQAIKPRTLTTMLFETARSIGESAVSSLIMWAIAGLRSLFKIVTAQRLILALLAFSTLTNLLVTSDMTSTWWGERKAASFMRSMGVGPNQMMSKAVYISDLTEASGTGGPGGGDLGMTFPTANSSTCFSTFKEVLDATDMDAPWEDAGASFSSPGSRATARRLRRTRQRLGSYRHDLLVAMRVVNSVEREMLQSEWENWLMNEKSLCDDLEVALKSNGEDKGASGESQGQDDAAQKRLGGMSSDRKKALEGFREEHCGSCRSDYQTMMKERRLGGI